MPRHPIETKAGSVSQLATLTTLRHYVKHLRREGKARPLVGILQSGWNFGKNAKDLCVTPAAMMRFHSATTGKDIPGLVDVIMNRFSGLLRPIQSINELTRWVERVAGVSPKVLVEIGTAKGGTFFLHSRAADPRATLISIDLPGGMYGGGYPTWKQGVFRHLIGKGPSVHFLRGDSHATETLAKVKHILGDRKIDVLFIDGDHTYEGAKMDFYSYGPLVRPGGLIGMHDILHNRFDKDIDVARLWTELKASLLTEEIVESYDQGIMGIGVVTVPQVGIR
jgi:predicted O-methyltransferase YrrM